MEKPKFRTDTFDEFYRLYFSISRSTEELRQLAARFARKKSRKEYHPHSGATYEISDYGDEMRSDCATLIEHLQTLLLPPTPTAPLKTVKQAQPDPNANLPNYGLF